jgi:anhydro-N-acetylmuramic acid kinase
MYFSFAFFVEAALRGTNWLIYPNLNFKGYENRSPGQRIYLRKVQNWPPFHRRGLFLHLPMNKNLSRLFDIAKRKDRYIVGLMSGTSLDGLDVALCKVSGHGQSTKIKLLEFDTVAYSVETKARIIEVFARPLVDFEKLCILNPWLGLLHAKIVLSCLKKWDYSIKSIDIIASHGQTVFHSPSFRHPQMDINATLQLGDGDHLASTTGIITVSDFRQKHIAKGGEGAPLAVYGDYLLLSHKTENRVLLNIGGIGNFTYLPAGFDAKKVFVTDTGPGNTLMDQMVRNSTPLHFFDKDAKLALRGRVHSRLLEVLKSDPFFHLPLPKTTGPELFNLAYIEKALLQAGERQVPLEDMLATLTRFSAETMAECIQSVVKKRKFEIYFSGGGMHNPLLVKWIQEILKIPKVQTTDVLGIPGDAKEAMLFAVLANETIAGGEVTFGGKSKVPTVTMGKISLPT